MGRDLDSATGAVASLSRSGQAHGARDRAGPTLAAVIGIGCGLGLATAVAGAVGLAGQTTTLQFGTFVVGFGLLLPLAALVAVRALDSGRDRELLADAALSTGSALVVLLCAMRVLDMAGIAEEINSAIAIAGGLAVAALAGFQSGRSIQLPSPAANLIRPSGRAAAVVAGLAVLALVVFVPKEVSPLALTAALGLGVIAAWLLPRLPAVRTPAPWLMDVLLLALLLALAIDVTGYWGSDFAVSAWSGLPLEELGPVAQIHQHFYLGAVGDVLAGRTLLVDSNAVYGIGNTYLIAGWFQLVPFGYGPFGLFGSLATASVIALGWGILRAATVGRLVAAAAVVTATMVTVLAPITSPSLFLNVGGLRFVPPYLLLAVALLVAGRRGPVTRSPWVLAAFAFFSLWSFEAIAYCGGTFLALAFADAIPGRGPRAVAIEVARSLAHLFAACVLAHLVFALATRLIGGEWPDWAGYVALFRAWANILEEVFGSQASAWSLSWVLGGAYLASGVGTLMLLRRGGIEQGIRWRRKVLALAGTSALGASLLSYFVAHSSDLFLPFIAFPALMVGALWLGVILSSEPGPGLAWKRAAVGVAVFVATMVIAGSWSESERRFPRTLLAHLIPGGPSLKEDARRMWDSPPVDHRSVSAEALLDRYFPAGRALVLVEPDLGQETLIRSGRANLLPIAYPWQDEVALGESLPPVLAAISELPAGTPILLQEPLEPEAMPSASLRFEQVFGNVPTRSRLGPLAQAALTEIEANFTLERIAEGADGLYVARLQPR